MCWCMDVCTIDCAVGHVRRLHGEKNCDSLIVFIILFFLMNIVNYVVHMAKC